MTSRNLGAAELEQAPQGPDRATGLGPDPFISPSPTPESRVDERGSGTANTPQARAVPQSCIKPYYEDESVVIYHADARALSDEMEFDAVLTDPPYGIEGGNGGDARDFAKGGYLASDWEDSPNYIKFVCVPIIRWLQARVVPMAVTPGIRNLWRYPQPRDMGCFWTPAAATHGPWGFTTIQPILYYGKDWRAGKGALPSGRAVTESAEKNGHPCPKPLSAWSWLLDKVCPPSGTVLDPFMGSGTTLRAAKDMGRKAIGIEIEERYCEIAARRMGQEVLDLGSAA